MADFFKDLVFSETDIITFPAGIPGFEQNKKFIIANVPEYLPFEWLVCVDGSRLRFAVINPMLFDPGYAPDIQKQQISELQIEKPEDILIYVIVTIRDNPMESTANLIGPVIINRTTRFGKQVIIDDERYTTQEPIIRK